MGYAHSFVGPGEARVKMRSDGMLEVTVSCVDMGTGAKTAMAIMAANALGVPIGSVLVTSGDTKGTTISSNDSTCRNGTAVEEAANKVKEKVLQLASGPMKTKAASLKIVDGFVTKGDGQ